jgi:hypothetical protein
MLKVGAAQASFYAVGVTQEADESPATDRLELFRRLRARLDPLGNPVNKLDALYVAAPRPVSRRIAAELSLAPASTHLILGGVGSGKTTELLAVQRALETVGDTKAFYVDVTKEHDVNVMGLGVVLLQVGLALGAWLAAEVSVSDATEREIRRLRDLAHGYHDPYHDVPDGGDESYVPGILHSPDVYDYKVATILEPLAQLRQATSLHVVALIDGLDRLTYLPGFARIVEEDVRALASLGIGVVLVGPLRAHYGIDRAAIERFDRLHYQPWIDVNRDEHGKAFLRDIIRRRAGDDALSSDSLDDLVSFSGGVVRDLLSIAQAACVEAYMRGDATIDIQHVVAATDAFGRKHMQGLRVGEIDVLRRVLTHGVFVETSEEDFALLMTRRLLEYRDQNNAPRYAVHPTIAQFLA